mgnify:CR=1 FL=1
MLPSERSDVFDHVGRRGDALLVKLDERRFEIERVPVDDGVDQQVQSGRPIELALEGSVPQLSEPIEKQRASQGILGLALVESGGRVPAHFRVLPPLGQEDGPIDASDVAQRERQSVLTRECGQLRQQGRRPDLAGTDSRDQSQDVIPVCLDPLDVDGLADKRCQVFRWRVAGEEIQACDP